jgi:predicted MFS family arabinose efflux permease
VLVTGLAFGVFAISASSIPGLVIGVVLLDLGVQAAQVANQVRIAGAAPDAESRMNTVYRVSYFIGGALGSALGMAAWSRWGWAGVCAVGGGMLVVALLAVVTPWVSGEPLSWRGAADAGRRHGIDRSSISRT